VTEQRGREACSTCLAQTDDVSSPQLVFSGYCSLLDGTTAFPCAVQKGKKEKGKDRKEKKRKEKESFGSELSSLQNDKR
jgi:hypothetical protein